MERNVEVNSGEWIVIVVGASESSSNTVKVIAVPFDKVALLIVTSPFEEIALHRPVCTPSTVAPNSTVDWLPFEASTVCPASE